MFSIRGGKNNLVSCYDETHFDGGTIVKCAEATNKYTDHVFRNLFALNVFNSVNGSISIDHMVLDCHSPRRDILQYRQSTTLSPHAQECVCVFFFCFFFQEMHFCFRCALEKIKRLTLNGYQCLVCGLF